MHTNKDVVQRLSRYKNVLYKLKSMGFVRVFSDNLADALGVSPSLVRKDFSVFGLSGNKRGGYRIDNLIAQLNEILGKGEVQNVVIVGCGKLGTALMNHKGFTRDHIRVIAGFDVDPAKINPSAPIPIHDIQELPRFLKREPLSVAIMTVPEAAAPYVLELLVDNGIRAILNFAPITLKGSDRCVIHNINVALEIENLCYFARLSEKGLGVGTEENEHVF
jgi:redox-sensing transcriptional repressor